MGSLSSRPNVPTIAPPPVIISQPSVVPRAQPTPQSGAAPSADGASNAAPSTEQAASQARERSLLGRARGRFGTIRTSFRGVLGLADNTSVQRKSLLGE